MISTFDKNSSNGLFQIQIVISMILRLHFQHLDHRIRLCRKVFHELTGPIAGSRPQNAPSLGIYDALNVLKPTIFIVTAVFGGKKSKTIAVWLIKVYFCFLVEQDLK